ncbi:histone-lysine N-methyltransferase SETMAR [Elysia marginata]|uniref:Histone-lysine N-methyltransferase SETMAR n=1 Tax=Elysia marginata TaxID=1093978 RepID=A0AAV4HM80_9GAST|nr:histone-lysine N-methyltransferase SETMAR [Elysia marginata]
MLKRWERVGSKESIESKGGGWGADEEINQSMVMETRNNALGLARESVLFRGKIWQSILTDDDAVQEDVRRWFRGKPHEFFADGMRKLIWRWRACVDKEGNYVEK